jgi:hypothetical protein
MTSDPIPPYTVVICDDEEGRRDEWKNDLEAALGSKVSVEMLTGWKDAWTPLLNRRKAARPAPAETKPGEQPRSPIALCELPETVFEKDWQTPFDRADVLLVDYDLFGFDQDNYLTGAVVSYLVRCFSKCKVIVGVNEYGANPFDLTLKPDPNSFSDVSIGEKQLTNLGLWTGEHVNGYRPWAWPTLLPLVDSFDRRVRQVELAPDAHVVDVCGLAEDVNLLPRSVVALLERPGQEDERTSLVDLARGPRLGYRAGDEAPSQPAVARVAAARAARWLEGFVLPLQEVVIDAPHLAARNPALLRHDVSRETLDATTKFGADLGELGLVDAAAKWRAETDDWLSRPALRWQRVRNDPDLGSRRRPTPGDESLVFCEDLSSFRPQSQARRFVSALDSSSPARWICDPQGPESHGVADVEYRPVSRLAL